MTSSSTPSRNRGKTLIATNCWVRPTAKLLALLSSEYRDYSLLRTSEIPDLEDVPKVKASMSDLRKYNDSIESDTEMIKTALCGHLMVVYALAWKHGLDIEELFEIVLTNDPHDCGFPMKCASK